MRRYLLVLPCLILFGCASTPQSTAPMEIPLPPVALLQECPKPQKLPELATQNETLETLLEALRWGGCERSRSIGFMQAWPKN